MYTGLVGRNTCMRCSLVSVRCVSGQGYVSGDLTEAEASCLDAFFLWTRRHRFVRCDSYATIMVYPFSACPKFPLLPTALSHLFCVPYSCCGKPFHISLYSGHSIRPHVLTMIHLRVSTQLSTPCLQAPQQVVFFGIVYSDVVVSRTSNAATSSASRNRRPNPSTGVAGGRGGGGGGGEGGTSSAAQGQGGQDRAPPPPYPGRHQVLFHTCVSFCGSDV